MSPREKVPTAAILIPPHPTLETLRAAAAACRACELWKRGTQTVFGEGPADARIMLVGEQPGNAEDLAGRPFVGPAGRLLDTCLEAAGLDRGQAYVTNIVKHFNWSGEEKRRIHQKPNRRHIQACLPWLQAEMALLRPEVLVLMGATAAQGLLGAAFLVSKERGKVLRGTSLAPAVMATLHPSSLLRIPDPARRRAETARFTQDLKKAASLLNPL